jgi:hypothetical protein
MQQCIPLCGRRPDALFPMRPTRPGPGAETRAHPVELGVQLLESGNRDPNIPTIARAALTDAAFQIAVSGMASRIKCGWLGDLDSNQDCSVQSREFYR